MRSKGKWFDTLAIVLAIVIPGGFLLFAPYVLWRFRKGDEAQLPDKKGVLLTETPK